MASVFLHTIVTPTLGMPWRLPHVPLRVWLLGAGCSVVPDLDMLGYWLGIPYDAPLGHRGLTHSLVFAVALSAFVVATAFRGAQLGRLPEARLNREIGTEAEERELVRQTAKG